MDKYYKDLRAAKLANPNERNHIKLMIEKGLLPTEYKTLLKNLNSQDAELLI